MTNGNAYSILNAYVLIRDFSIQGVPFSVQRLAQRNVDKLMYLHNEKISIYNTPDKTKQEHDEAWEDFLSLPFQSQIEQLDEAKIENIPNQRLSNGHTTNEVFAFILDVQNPKL